MCQPSQLASRFSSRMLLTHHHAAVLAALPSACKSPQALLGVPSRHLTYAALLAVFSEAAVCCPIK